MSDSVSTPTPGVVRLAEFEFQGTPLQLEYTWISRNGSGPLMIFLHEGLGSLRMWRAFPEVLCAALGCRGLVYSRCGYGDSSPLWGKRQWPGNFMHVEAREILPRLMTVLGLDTADPPILFGHSDGASIALIHAASFPGRVLKVIAMAPHIFVEGLTIASIEKTRQAFVESNLCRRLEKYHRDAAETFCGWAGIWLDPEFRAWNIENSLPSLACPVLAIQGYDDQYGTLRQIDGIQASAPRVRTLKLARCGHSPHIDQPGAVINAAAEFLRDAAG